MEHINKSNMQLMPRCLFCKATGEAILTNYSKYYPVYRKKKLFN